MKHRILESDVLQDGFEFPPYSLFWFMGFAYASFMALLLQKAVLPMFPEMHAGHGLLMNDAIVFHNMAVEIAQKIHVVGWSEWRLYPQGASANVGLLSALYALLGPDPAWFIPFNAASHATSALLIYIIGSRLVSGKVGRLSGLFGGICFLVFPSALQWYGQNHKDAFAILGMLLALSAWLKLNEEQFKIRSIDILSILLTGFFGAGLLGLVRPYYVLVMTFGFIVSFFISSVWRSKLNLIFARLVFIVQIAVLAVVFAQMGTAVGVYAENPTTSNFEAYDGNTANSFIWKESEYLPKAIEKTLQRASELRAHFVHFGRSVGAGSEIDGDRLPGSALAAMAYLPRALLVGLFAPFPDTWGDRVTLPRLIGAMETAFWYLAILGAPIALVRYRSRKLIAGLVFCATLITILAFVHPNVGTLYRQRYGLWQFFLLIGCMGWVGLFSSILMPGSVPLNRSTISNDDPCEKTLIRVPQYRLAGSGAVVMLITLVCYLGFFARDLMLMGQLGLGGDLDAFFSAAMITMFFVSCLAMPLGDAMVLPFVAKGVGAPEERQRILQGVLSFGVVILFSVTCLVVAISPLLAALVIHSATLENQTKAAEMVRCFAPIIAMSAWTVVGNAGLNSLGKHRDAAIGQLAVPVSTLAALVLAPESQVTTASISGMLIGTFVNVGIVWWRLRAVGLDLLPSKTPISATSEVRSNYWHLAGAAVFPAAIIPMNYAFAASVTAGTLAAWAFASKIVVLFSGLASVAATAVVLPHMAHRLTAKAGENAGQDANRLMAMGVWLGGVMMLAGFLFAEPMVGSLLGKRLSESQITELALIVKVGLMQIPIVIVGALANKLAVASGRTSRVLHAAIFAFSINLLMNILLVPKVGVLGVAVSTLIGGAMSLAVVLAGVYRQIGLAPREILLALCSWLALVGVSVALLSGSSAAMASAIIALGTMARLQWIAVRANSLTAHPSSDAPCSI